MGSWKTSRFGRTNPNDVREEAGLPPRDQTLHVPLYHTPRFTPNDVQASQFNFFLVGISPEMESALFSAVETGLGINHSAELSTSDCAGILPYPSFSRTDEESANSLFDSNNAPTPRSDAMCWDDQDATVFISSDTRDDVRLEDLLNTNNPVFRTSPSCHEILLQELVKAAMNAKASSKRHHGLGPIDTPQTLPASAPILTGTGSQAVHPNLANATKDTTQTTLCEVPSPPSSMHTSFLTRTHNGRTRDAHEDSSKENIQPIALSPLPPAATTLKGRSQNLSTLYLPDTPTPIKIAQYHNLTLAELSIIHSTPLGSTSLVKPAASSGTCQRGTALTSLALPSPRLAFPSSGPWERLCVELDCLEELNLEVKQSLAVFGLPPATHKID